MGEKKPRECRNIHGVCGNQRGSADILAIVDLKESILEMVECPDVTTHITLWEAAKTIHHRFFILKLNRQYWAVPFGVPAFPS